MARGRRPSGTLDVQILSLLEREGGPLSGLTLAQMLHDEGRTVAASLVFRALRKLVERGILHKLLLVRGYVRVQAPHEVYLCCTGCGAVTTIMAEEPFSKIDRAAAKRGFAVVRPIIEIAGRCDCCSKRVD